MKKKKKLLAHVTPVKRNPILLRVHSSLERTVIRVRYTSHAFGVCIYVCLYYTRLAKWLNAVRKLIYCYTQYIVKHGKREKFILPKICFFIDYKYIKYHTQTSYSFLVNKEGPSICNSCEVRLRIEHICVYLQLLKFISS